MFVIKIPAHQSHLVLQQPKQIHLLQLHDWGDSMNLGSVSLFRNAFGIFFLSQELVNELHFVTEHFVLDKQS